MIFQENEFLKTYNEIDKLWEDTATPKRSVQASRSFKEIITKAAEFKEYGFRDKEDIAFWEEVQRLIWGKYRRINQPQDKNPWPERLVNAFYKPFLTENAIKASLSKKRLDFNSDSYEVSINFGDFSTNDIYRDFVYLDSLPDGNDAIEIESDFTVPISISIRHTGKNLEWQNTDNFLVECKSQGATSNKHQAQLTLVYKASYNKNMGSCSFQTVRNRANNKNKSFQAWLSSWLGHEPNLRNYKDLVSFIVNSLKSTSFNFSYDTALVEEANKLLATLNEIYTALNSDESSHNHVISTVLADQAIDLVNTANSIKQSAESAGAPISSLKMSVDDIRSKDSETLSPDEAAVKLTRAADYLARTALNTVSADNFKSNEDKRKP